LNDTGRPIEEVLGVTVERASTHVFGHANRTDGVERSVGDVSKVLHAKVDEVAHSCESRLLGRVLPLRLRERNADDVDTVGTRGVNGHGTPSATHVEEAHTRLQLKFLGDEVDLSLLGDLEGVIRRAKDGARIGHRRSQHHFVEVVGDVVVVGDRLLVA
jgi:hypothetical protein